MSIVLGLKRYTKTVDRYGDEVVGWADPVDWPVHGIAPGPQGESFDPTRDRSVIAWTVYAPKTGPVPHERDRVLVDGIEFDIDGRPADWTRGPWEPRQRVGIVVELRRIEG